MNSLLQYLSSWLLLVAPQPCYDELFVKFNFFHGECVKVVISKCLGYGIIIGAILVKLPQILKIVFAKSGEGISLASVSLELVAVSASLAYGYANKYPFSSYGESGFLATQTLIIALLVLLFNGQATTGLLYLLAYGGAMMFLMSGAAPMTVLTGLQTAVMPITAAAKLIQAAQNYRNGSTGQLSAITVFLLFFGSLARVFTSIQETGDNIIVLTFVVSTLANGVIFAQILYYWSSDKQKTKKE